MGLLCTETSVSEYFFSVYEKVKFKYCVTFFVG